jgi:PIN domain nuclease of toxin-antitoxin system
LDTSVIVSTLANDDRMSESTRDRLRDPDSDCHCSIVSLWEIAIKLALRKLTLAVPLREVRTALTERSNIGMLGLEHDHVVAIGALSHHHRDPFDRMLIAQAQSERMTIVTRDRIFERYDVGVLIA